jgi:hypothetical protein
VKEEEKGKIEEAAEEEEEMMVTPKKCGDIGTEGKPCGKGRKLLVPLVCRKKFFFKLLSDRCI